MSRVDYSDKRTLARLWEKVKERGGPGGSVSWNDITGKPDNLATTDDIDAKVFVATYNVTTAQEIIAYLDAAQEPFAPILIKRGNDYYTCTTAAKQADNKVIIRSFATLSGNFFMFTYTVTNGSWSSSSYGFQQLLESGTNIKTVGGQSILGSGNIPISGGGGQDNVIESISVNGIAQAVDANKNVDLLVPTYSKNTAAFAAYDEGAEFNLQPSTNGMTASWAEGTTVVSSELTSKTYVDGELAGKSSFDIASISTAGGGTEVHATLTQGEEAASLNYYKDSELPTALNLNVGEDAFRIPTTGYVDNALANKQDTLVSGTNIKTVNGESLLGAGNVVAGMNLEVGKERWQGTYTDENGETFQVYSKMVYIPALPATAGITTYDHGVSNIKQILNIYGFTADGFVLNAPRQNAQDNIAIYQASKSATNQTFSIEVGKDRSNKKAYVVMVYAKNN